jgi:hypothetical protein
VLQENSLVAQQLSRIVATQAKITRWKTEGERRRVNGWKEENVGGFKGRHFAGLYIYCDPIKWRSTATG